MWNFLQRKNLLKPTQRPKKRYFRPSLYFLTVYVRFSRRLKLSSAELTLFLWFLSFLSFISPKNCKPPPSNYQPLFIYFSCRVIMMREWFFMLVGPYGTNSWPNEPTSHDWSNSLETCTHHQMVLDRRFPSRHYHFLLCLGPNLALGPRLCDLMRIDGLDVDFILDSNLIWTPTWL